MDALQPARRSGGPSDPRVRQLLLGHPLHGDGDHHRRRAQRQPAALLGRDDFVETLLAGFGEYPSYFAHMAERNRSGAVSPAYRDPIPVIPEGDLEELAARLWVIDVRPAPRSRGPCTGDGQRGRGRPSCHLRRMDHALGRPVRTVGGRRRPADEGAGHARPHRLGPAAGIGHPLGPGPVGRAAPRQVRDLAAEWTDDVTVIDVRRQEEWDQGHLEGALHIPVHRLVDAEMPDGRLWLHCAAGYRAVLGASLLLRDKRDVVAIDDAWPAAEAVGLPIATLVGR